MSTPTDGACRDALIKSSACPLNLVRDFGREERLNRTPLAQSKSQDSIKTRSAQRCPPHRPLVIHSYHVLLRPFLHRPTLLDTVSCTRCQHRRRRSMGPHGRALLPLRTGTRCRGYPLPQPCSGYRPGWVSVRSTLSIRSRLDGLAAWGATRYGDSEFPVAE